MCMIQIKSKVWSLEDFNDEAPAADHFKQKEIKKKKKKVANRWQHGYCPKQKQLEVSHCELGT